MFVFVHSFPDGYRPSPQISLAATTENGVETPVVVSLETQTVKGANGGEDTEKIVKVIVESGQIDVTNVPIPIEAGKPAFVDGTATIGKTAVELPGTVFDEKKQTIIAEARLRKIRNLESSRACAERGLGRFGKDDEDSARKGCRSCCSRA